MEWLDVLQRIHSGEDERTELERSFDAESAGAAICAFANTEGGMLVLGVADDQHIVGVADAERLSEQLTSLLQDKLSAPVQARLGRHEDAKGWVHWVEVPRQRGFEPLKHKMRVYVRRGRASVQPAPAELQELYNVFGYVLTEERTIGDSTVSDVDEQAFRAFLVQQKIDPDDEPRLPIAQDYLARGVVAEIGGELRATLYGWLAFGRRPQGAPQTRSFWVECAAYAGEDRAADVLQVAEGKGTLFEQAERALGWLRGLGRQEVYQGDAREDVGVVPEIAAREAIINALAHRDYAIMGSKVLVEVFSDRVVVTSPGTLPNHMTPDSVMRGGHPRSRNELIANYFFVQGRLEGRGRGWPRMRRAMRDAGRPDPILEQDRDGPFVRVTFLRS